MVRAGCVFVAGIHLSRTWTSGSFESVRWNACMHRLDLGLYSHPKEFLGEWSLNPCLLHGKNPLYRKCPQRRIEPTTLWTASPSTTSWAIPAPSPIPSIMSMHTLGERVCTTTLKCQVSCMVTTTVPILNLKVCLNSGMTAISRTWCGQCLNTWRLKWKFCNFKLQYL